MFKSYGNFWKGYANWTGKATRSEWWWVFLWNFIIPFILVVPWLPFIEYAVQNYGGNSNYESGRQLVNSGTSPALMIICIVLLVVYSLAILVPTISLTIRRLRDAGLPWGLYFINFVPFVGALAVFILLQLPTKNIDL